VKKKKEEADKINRRHQFPDQKRRREQMQPISGAGRQSLRRLRRRWNE